MLLAVPLMLLVLAIAWWVLTRRYVPTGTPVTLDLALLAIVVAIGVVGGGLLALAMPWLWATMGLL